MFVWRYEGAVSVDTLSDGKVYLVGELTHNGRGGGEGVWCGFKDCTPCNFGFVLYGCALDEVGPLWGIVEFIYRSTIAGFSKNSS